MTKSQQAYDALTQLFNAGNVIAGFEPAIQDDGKVSLRVTIISDMMNESNDVQALKSFREKLLTVAKAINFVLGGKGFTVEEVELQAMSLARKVRDQEKRIKELEKRANKPEKWTGLTPC